MGQRQPHLDRTLNALKNGPARCERRGHDAKEQALTHTQVTRHCRECLAPFETDHSHRSYCSDACRERRNRRDARWRRKRGSILRGATWWDSTPTTAERGEYYEALRRDPCAYCGAAGGEIDHISPRGHGGANQWDNTTGACRSCNSSKQTLSLTLGLLAMQIQRDIGPALDELRLIRGIEVRQWRTYASVSAKA
jgi:hypothetical protein